ncbi:hypothetical protein BJV82DRAFT_552106 [Fennellomyces sp. T-0311]|nr:hypothetical protein BJV82DRAFT_552106 [Fennellomyces sp. T-0311]
MVQSLSSLLFLILTIRFGISALQVNNIKDCPNLPKRSESGAKDVTDLRPDDIKVIGALGDSIIAGALMMNNDHGKLVTYADYAEYRGNSYAIGGNTNAITLAKFFQHYSPLLKGASIGERLATGCTGKILSFKHHPIRDRLNAAISGGTAVDLDKQVDYLISRMKSMVGVNYNQDWKFVTLQIGSNDMCAACDTSADSSVETYGKLVSGAIERIRTSIPRVVVNLLGTFRVSELYSLTGNALDYCQSQNNDPDTIFNRLSCSCFIGAESNRTIMDVLSKGYNEKLVEIYERYKSQHSSTFAVRYLPVDISIDDLPLEVLSDFDCFHPSLIAHQWIAKLVWNTLFTTQQEEESHLSWGFNANETIYCPTVSDRIDIYS